MHTQVDIIQFDTSCVAHVSACVHLSPSSVAHSSYEGFQVSSRHVRARSAVGPTCWRERPLLMMQSISSARSWLVPGSLVRWKRLRSRLYGYFFVFLFSGDKQRRTIARPKIHSWL